MELCGRTNLLVLDITGAPESPEHVRSFLRVPSVASMRALCHNNRTKTWPFWVKVVGFVFPKTHPNPNKERRVLWLCVEGVKVFLIEWSGLEFFGRWLRTLCP